MSAKDIPQILRVPSINHLADSNEPVIVSNCCCQSWNPWKRPHQVHPLKILYKTVQNFLKRILLFSLNVEKLTWTVHRTILTLRLRARPPLSRESSTASSAGETWNSSRVAERNLKDKQQLTRTRTIIIFLYNCWTDSTSTYNEQERHDSVV